MFPKSLGLGSRPVEPPRGGERGGQEGPLVTCIDMGLAVKCGASAIVFCVIHKTGLWVLIGVANHCTCCSNVSGE